ncbi:hypothetical protein B0H17DRAFT_77107 [Mycena rosella]|uniref:Uncharacterized protein n=1 Tax=Mycena rosella TaxID=1033263 RepID=A0AAD7D5R2_MYCRO|nr:hypothetical protein B0H17DRAFT_77107 [Mycena rosella]
MWDQYRAKANRSSWAHLASSLCGLRSICGTWRLHGSVDGQRTGSRALAAHAQLSRMRGSVRVCGMRARMREVGRFGGRGAIAERRSAGVDWGPGGRPACQ